MGLVARTCDRCETFSLSIFRYPTRPSFLVVSLFFSEFSKCILWSSNLLSHPGVFPIRHRVVEAPQREFCLWFRAEGSCRHSFTARPVRLHPPGCLVVVRNILTYAFPLSTTYTQVFFRVVVCSFHV